MSRKGIQRQVKEDVVSLADNVVADLRLELKKTRERVANLEQGIIEWMSYYVKADLLMEGPQYRISNRHDAVKFLYELLGPKTQDDDINSGDYDYMGRE